MLCSRVQLVNDFRSMNAILQDTYDGQDDYDNSNDASLENFYDAQTESGLHEIRINMEPNDRLIEAIESLREVILENTNAQQKSRRRGRTAPSSANSPMYKANGTILSIKDEKLKIRKEKVRLSFYSLPPLKGNGGSLFCIELIPHCDTGHGVYCCQLYSD